MVNKPPSPPASTEPAARPVILLAHTPAMRRDFYGAEALAALRRLGEVRLHGGDAPLSGAALLAAARDAQVLVADRMTAGPASLFAGLPGLRAFVRVAVDIRDVDVDAASASGVLVTRAGPGFVDAVAELALGLMVDLLRGVSGYVAEYRQGRVPAARAGRQLRGGTVGIVGYGGIGRRLAVLCDALGMTVLATDPHAPVAAPARPVALPELLGASDVVVLLANATAETANLLDAAALALMPAHAVVLNLGRGELVDEAALAAALREGRIAGAAMDVGRGPDQTPSPALAALPNVVATPHVGGMTPEAVASQAGETVEQVRLLLRGEAPPGAVNAGRWTRRG